MEKIMKIKKFVVVLIVLVFACKNETKTIEKPIETLKTQSKPSTKFIRNFKI